VSISVKTKSCFDTFRVTFTGRCRVKPKLRDAKFEMGLSASNQLDEANGPLAK